MPPRKQQPKNTRTLQTPQKTDTPDFIRLFRLHKYYNDRFADLAGSGQALGLDMPISYYLEANPRRVSVKFFHELLHQRLGLSITRISDIIGHILRVGNLDMCSLPAMIN